MILSNSSLTGKTITRQKNIFSAIMITSFLLIVTNSSSFAYSNSTQTEITPINDQIGIEKTTLQMLIPKENKLPWGFVEGKISNHVAGYPVIIQIFDNDKTITGNKIGAVHFAQTLVNDNGSYEYKFRVFDSKQGQIKHIFEGGYTVKIFKVVYLDSNHDVI
jgi:hypothetical protein